MSRIATVRPVGHIGQRNVRRRVGPEQVGQFHLRASGDQTGVRTAPPRTVQNPSGAPAASNAAASRSVPVRVEEIEDETMRKARYLDKLIDELAKGKAMEEILRK